MPLDCILKNGYNHNYHTYNGKFYDTYFYDDKNKIKKIFLEYNSIPRHEYMIWH